MPLNSVQQYVKGIMNGLALPNSETLTAVITPPNPGDGLIPTVYIWGSTINEERQSMPRAKPGQPSTGGMKELKYNLDMWLMWFGPADGAGADSAFPAVIDTCTAQLRTTQIQVSITDAISGQVSTVQEIGEVIKVDYMPVIALEDERWLRYDARLIVQITERLQA